MDTDPDFTTWAMPRLTAQRDHLSQILLVSVGQDDPEKPKIRGELRAILAELARREQEGP